MDRLFGLRALLLAAALPASGCGEADACPEDYVCVAEGGGQGGAPSTSISSTTATSSTGGDDGGGGMGGSPPCDGACMEPTPLCDEGTNMCVACLGDGDCDSVTASDCVNGSCAQ